MCRVETVSLGYGYDAMLRDYTTLYNTVDSYDNPEHIELPVEYFQSSFSYPNVNLSEDFVLVRNNAGELIASGTIFSDAQSTLSSRLSVHVHPEYRNQGIGSMVLNQLIERGLKRGSSEYVCRFPSFRPYVTSFVQKHGFRYDYTWLKMQVNLKSPALVFPHPLGLTIRALNVKKELAVWAQLQNAIFKDYPGYKAVNTEVLDSITKHSTFDSSLLVIGTYFSRPIGYCLGFSFEPLDQEKILRIEGMGVLPEFRRRGYGCALVSEILKRAYIKDHASSELVVLSSNTSAISLYAKCGFKESCRHLWYMRTFSEHAKGSEEISG
jgi:ribosomal protein S18 acetylase RimI-like enzyme